LTAFRALPHVHLRHLAALPDLKGQPGAAVLVTGAGFAYYDAQIDTMAVQWNAMGTALSKAAQHKVVGLLGEKLKGDGVYVGEVVVMGVAAARRSCTSGDARS
jgi:hypothetical protein